MEKRENEGKLVENWREGFVSWGLLAHHRLLKSFSKELNPIYQE